MDDRHNRGAAARETSLSRSLTFLKTCEIDESVPLPLARRAARRHGQARRGSAVDAIVVAVAEPNGVVLTGDVDDIAALAAHAPGMGVERA